MTSTDSHQLHRANATRTTIWLLAASRLLALAGFEAALIAVIAMMYQRTGSAAQMSAAFAVSIGAAALAAPIGGWLGDHLDRRKLMIGSELGNAACYACIPIVHGIAPTLALLALAACAGAPFGPALNASIPGLVAKTDLVRANARIAQARTLGHLCGPLLGGVLVAGIGARGAFAFTASVLLLSAVLVACCRGDFQPAAAPLEGHHPRSRSPLAGLHAVARDVVLRRVIAAWFIVSVSFGIIVAAELPLALSFGVDEVGYGAIASSWAAGSLVGGFGARRVADRWEPGAVLVTACAVIGVALAAVAVTPWFTGVLVGMVCGGMAMAVASVIDTTLVQNRAAEHVRSRVLAANELVLLISFGASLPLGGLIADRAGAQPAYAVAALLDLVGMAIFVRAARAIAIERGSIGGTVSPCVPEEPHDPHRRPARARPRARARSRRIRHRRRTRPGSPR